jgi:citronellol/citronellal dehydrogenase
MSSLKGKTLFITGASRGIGLAIALRAARDGANVAVAAKTADPHPKLPGTVYTACEAIEQAGGKALACVTDIRFEDQVKEAVEKTAATSATRSFRRAIVKRTSAACSATSRPAST